MTCSASSCRHSDSGWPAGWQVMTHYIAVAASLAIRRSPASTLPAIICSPIYGDVSTRPRSYRRCVGIDAPLALLTVEPSNDDRLVMRAFLSPGCSRRQRCERYDRGADRQELPLAGHAFVFRRTIVDAKAYGRRDASNSPWADEDPPAFCIDY